MSGPPPEPTALRILRGNAGKRPINEREPQPGALRGVVKPPAWLSASARRIWREQVPVLQRMSVLTEADLQAAAMMCAELAVYAEMQRVLAKEGRTYRLPTKNGGSMLMPRPEVGIANAAAATFVKLADRFGMDPAYRSKLKVEAERERDPLDALRDDDDRAG